MFDDYIRTCKDCTLGSEDAYCPGEGCINYGTPMVIGMNPGADEARDKRPFVGPSSRIRELLQGDYYWTNIVKCAGRVARCPYCRWLDKEINAIKPLKLVLLGGEVCKRLTGHVFKAGVVYNIPTLYGWIQAWSTWHPSPANNYNWARLRRQCVEIQQWLKE